MGKKFPKRDGKGPAGLNYAGVVAAALRTELGDTHQAIKTVMRWTGSCERTAKNWLAGTRGPTGGHLLTLVRNSNAVFEAVLRLSGREASLTAIDLLEARKKLLDMVKSFDRLLGSGPFA